MNRLTSWMYDYYVGYQGGPFVPRYSTRDYIYYTSGDAGQFLYTINA